MANTANSTPVSRRRFFLASGSAAAVFGTVSAFSGCAAPALADAELIRLGHQFRAAWAAERDGFSQQVSDDRADELVEACTALADQIHGLPAQTIEGLKVKAEAVSWCYCGKFDGFGATTDQRIAAGIIKDLLAMA